MFIPQFVLVMPCLSGPNNRSCHFEAWAVSIESVDFVLPRVLLRSCRGIH